VINLSVDEPAVLAETFRVLQPGGRIGVTDVVAEDDLTPEQRAERGSYVECMPTPLSFAEYREGHSTAERGVQPLREGTGQYQPNPVGQAPIVTCTLEPGSDGVDLLVGEAADGRPAHAAPPAWARICAAAYLGSWPSRKERGRSRSKTHLSWGY
jgi:hypothetical protein